MKKIYLLSLVFFAILMHKTTESSAQCQTITATVSTSIPIDPVDSVLKICQGTTVTFTGNAIFETSSVGATYDWWFNNEPGYSSTTTFTYTFTTEGVYIIDFYPVDAEGCPTTDCDSRQIVHVSATPNFYESIIPDSVCLNSFAILNGVPTPNPQEYECAPPISDTTFLPDGSGAIYTTSIDVTCFTACDTIASGTDIENLCLILEHSYLGDLEIVLICPNGQEVTVKPYPGGGSTYLGEPLDYGGSDGLVGVGWQYCFNDMTPNPTLLGAIGGGFGVPGSGTPAGTSIAAGEYSPHMSFDGMIGCPLNGTWTIEVTDHLWSDDGYIFGWWIDFNTDIESYSFTNSYPTQYWTGPFIATPGDNPATISPTDTGMFCYTFHVVDNFTCDYDTTMCLYVKDLPNPGADTSIVLCQNLGEVNLFDYLGGTPDPGGYWSGTAISTLGFLNTEDIDEGVYSYTYTVQNTFCDTSATITLEIRDAIDLDFEFTYGLGCTEDTVNFKNLTEDELIYIRWEFGDGTNLIGEEDPSHIYSPQGEYSVWMVAINADGCVDSLQKLINTLHPLEARFDQSNDSICQLPPNVLALYDRSVGDIAEWAWTFGDGQTSDVQNPSITFTQYGEHEIRLIVTDVLGCMDTAYSKIYVDSFTQLNVWYEKEEICKGDIVKINSEFHENIQKLHWDFGDGTYKYHLENSINHSYTEIGNFVVTLTADHPVCPASTAKDTILVKPYPVINLGSDTFLCLKGTPLYLDPHSLTGNPANTKYYWSHGDSSSVTKITVPGTYSLMADLDGCITRDEFEVNKDCYIDIPNAFTPNGDGDNDYFFPRQYLSEGVVDFKMEIYNRWGEKIFETSNPDGRGWDGKFNNKDQPVGVYVFQITVRYKNQTSEKYTGDVTLLR